MHFLGDPGLLTQPGLVVAQLALGLGPLSPVPERHHQVPPRTYIRTGRRPRPDPEGPGEQQHPGIPVVDPGVRYVGGVRGCGQYGERQVAAADRKGQQRQAHRYEGLAEGHAQHRELCATAIGGAIAGHGTSYAGLGGTRAGAYLTTALNVVMGAAFGAVIAQTAILVFFIAPTVWALAGPALFKDNADWLDVFVAFGRIAERQLHGTVPETLTAVGVWIVLPTLGGLWESSRREVN